jgi:hypothetical protein
MQVTDDITRRPFFVFLFSRETLNIYCYDLSR